MSNIKNYHINEIFYSLQGEGRNTGRAAVFIRFAGCNLRCPFCDTEFDSFTEMTSEAILETIKPYPTRFIVLTGGEPTLQADEAFIDLLHRHGYEVAMESNGTRPAPRNLDWLTVSPKVFNRKEKEKKEDERKPDEIKLVFEENTDPETVLSAYEDIHASHPTTASPLLYLQPCDSGDAERNARIMKACIEYILQHPWWQLSLQTHKLIDIK